MIRKAVLSLALVLLAGVAYAGTCAFVSSPVVVSTPVVVHKEVVTPVVPVVAPVVAPVAVFVPVPTYGAVYTPPVAPAVAAPAATAPASELKAVLDSLRAIDTRLKSLELRGPAPAAAPRPADPFNPPQPQPQASTAPVSPPGALAIVQAKCVQCHDDKGAAEKGGGLVLVEGGALKRLSAADSLRTIRSAYKGAMPKKSSGIAPLTDEEVAALVAHYGG